MRLAGLFAFMGNAMPWETVKEHSDCPTSKPWGVINKDTGDLKGCHKTKKAANKQIAALHVQVEDSRQMSERVSWVSRAVQVLSSAIDSLTGVVKEADRAMGLGRLFRQVDDALWAMEGMPWLHDLYRDDDGSIFAIASSQGKLFSYAVEVDGDEVSLGDGVRVEETFTPVRTRTATRIIRQADGRVRWLSMSCTSVLNRVGEIDSRSLFDSFVAHAEETGEYPYRTFYHQGEAFRTGLADFLAREGNVYITSGLYDEDSVLAPYEAKALEENPEFWGESIGYRATESPTEIEVAPGVAIPVFNRGINREISLLPEGDAAAWFTHITTQREVSRMREKVFNALVELVGDEDKAKEFAELVDGTNRSIEEENLITREGDEAETEDRSGESDVQEQEQEQEIEMDEETMEAISNRFNGLIESALEPLVERVAALEESVKAVAGSVEAMSSETSAAFESTNERLGALERDDDEKRDEWQRDLPRRPVTKVSYRPRQVKSGQDRDQAKPSMADAAEATLSNLPSYRRR